MKAIPVFFLRRVAMLLVAGLLPVTASALVITQTVDQVSQNAAGWTAAVWGDPAAVAVSGNDYVTPSGMSLRTPDSQTASTFAGDSVRISSGARLRLKNGGALNGIARANLILNGGSISYNTANGTSISAIGGTLNVAGNSVIDSLAGGADTRDIWLLSSLSGTGNLSINSMANNALVLLGTNTAYSGNWTINSGRIEIGTNAVNPLGSGSVSILNGTNSLVFNTSGDLTLNNAIGGTGFVMKRSSGSVVLTANNTFTGGLTNQAGTLVLAGSGAQNFTRIDGDSVLRIAHSGALPAGSGVRVNAFDAQTGRLELSNNITVGTGLPIELGMRGNSSVALQNVHGNNVIADALGISTGGTLPVRIQADTGTTLELAGGINSLATGTRSVWLQGEGNGLISGPIGNGSATTFSVTKSGGGTWTLANAATHTGGTTISGGKLEIASSGSLGGSVSVNGSALNVASGGALTATDLTLGLNTVGGTNLAAAGATVSIGAGPANSLIIGHRTSSGDGVNAYGFMDVSPLSSFTANVGNLLVGVNANANGSGAAASGELRLAVNNTITATNIVLGDSSGSGSGLNSVMTLGVGSSTVTTPRLTVGGRKERGTLSLNSGGTLTLNNGAGRTVLNIGVQNIGTSVTPAPSLMDVSAGTFIASLDTLSIGLKAGGSSGGDSGTLQLGASAGNDVNVNTVVIGSLSGAGSGSPVGQGTINFSGGSFRVNNDVTLGSFSGDFGSAVGTLNLNGGTFAVAGDVTDGGGSSTLNLNAGVLDLKPAGDDTAGSVTVDALVLNGTLNNALDVTVGQLSGSGTIANQAGVTTVLESLAPGSSLGVLTIQGALTLDGSSSSNFEINKAGATLTSDSVQGISSLTHGGTLNVSLNSGSDALTGGETFALFQAGSYGGSLPATGDLPALPAQTPALNWYLGGLMNDGTITVNRAPVAKTITMGAQGGNSAALQIIGGKHAPADADGNPLVVSEVNYTSGNGAEVATDETSVTYVNNTGFIGTDSFTYTVSDGRGGVDTKTVTVEVSSGNSVSPNVVYGPAVDTETSEIVVRFAGIPGTVYTVETNSVPNGAGWNKLGNYTAPTVEDAAPFGAGIFEVRDALVGEGSRFYRTTHPSY